MDAKRDVDPMFSDLSGARELTREEMALLRGGDEWAGVALTLLATAATELAIAATTTEAIATAPVTGSALAIAVVGTLVVIPGCAFLGSYASGSPSPGAYYSGNGVGSGNSNAPPSLIVGQ